MSDSFAPTPTPTGRSPDWSAERFTYQPVIDGVRAVAIALVMGVHAESLVSRKPYFFRGGGIGVDLFFVLSGYLITSLLLEEWRVRGSISFKRFYLRRALRLLPALVVFLGTVGIVASVLDAGSKVTAGWILAALFYVANWG